MDNNDPNLDIIDDVIQPITDTPPSDTPDTPPSEDFTEYITAAVDQGLLDLPEDFEIEPTEEGFKKALEESRRYQSEKTKQQLLSSISQELLPIVEYALQGGQSLDEILQVAPKEYPTDTEEQQREVIKQFYKSSTNLSDARINSLLAKLDDPEELREEALSAKDELVRQQNDKKAALEKRFQEAREAEQQRAIKTAETIKSTIEEYAESKPLKTKLSGFFFNEIKTQDGKVTSEFSNVLSSILQNPLHTVQLAELLIDYNSKKGINFERFEKKGATQANISMKTLLEKSLNKDKKTPQVPPKEKFDWEAFLNNY